MSRRSTKKYCVVKFVAKHLHVLTSRKRMFLKSQRTIALAQAIEAELMDSSGVAPKATIGLMARMVGRIDNLSFIPKNYNNYLHIRPIEDMKIGDTSGLHEYLQKKCNLKTLIFLMQFKLTLMIL